MTWLIVYWWTVWAITYGCYVHALGARALFSVLAGILGGWLLGPCCVLLEAMRIKK